jgi:hypothetical protein
MRCTSRWVVAILAALGLHTAAVEARDQNSQLFTIPMV